MNFDPKDACILIVDDTIKNLQLLGTILEQEGYQINVAQNGVQALDIAEKVHPDLILLDVMMPKMDGLEACKLLKEKDGLADIPVVFLTARTETEDIVKGFELGAVDYVTKPFNATELLVRVRTHLSVYLLQSALRHSLDENARLRREQEALLRHELKNRLSPMLGYSDMLVHKIQDDRLRRWAETIGKGVEDMDRLIDTLRNLQDIESGATELLKVDLDLNVFLNHIVTDLSTVFGDRTEMILECEAAAVTVAVDGNLMQGVFHNLIKNAVEHVADLEDIDQRRVRVRVGRASNRVVVSIHNGGAPISPERVVSFFEKFNTQDKPDGTGLGTTYADLVTRAHDGEVAVISSEAEGTTVTVTLPVV